MFRRLAIASVRIEAIRNIGLAQIDPSPRFNVISGNNGQGKTNLLEAIYLVATSRSFRTTKTSEILQRGSASGSVRMTLVEGEESRAQVLSLEHGQRRAMLNGKRPSSLAEFASRTPVVVFHPGELALSTGGGAERRRLLDRIQLYRSPRHAPELSAYNRAVRERQRALEQRGTSARDLDQWEELISRHGSAVILGRADSAGGVADAAARAFSVLGHGQHSLCVEYVPGAPPELEAFRAKLSAQRATDLRRGAASIGAHRDDLKVTLDGQPVRGFASQGQHRAVVLALKAAEAALDAQSRGVRPVLLLDDVSSELDRSRTAALMSYLREEEGQVFLTTTRPELIDVGPGSDRLDVVVEAGSVRGVKPQTPSARTGC